MTSHLLLDAKEIKHSLVLALETLQFSGLGEKGAHILFRQKFNWLIRLLMTVQ